MTRLDGYRCPKCGEPLDLGMRHEEQEDEIRDLREQLADRKSDLEHEHAERVRAEAVIEAITDPAAMIVQAAEVMRELKLAAKNESEADDE